MSCGGMYQSVFVLDAFGQTESGRNARSLRVLPDSDRNEDANAMSFQDEGFKAGF